MKKFRLFSTLAATLLAVGAFAQTDVTSSYLKNADFSEQQTGPVVSPGVCTYDYDMTSNNTTYYALTEVDNWERCEGGTSNARAGGVFKYASGSWLGGSSFIVPEEAPEGSTSDYCLGVLGVWGGQAQYTQTFTLPAGAYFISFTYYNVGGTVAIDTNLTGVVLNPDDEENKVENFLTGTTFEEGKWITETIELNLTEETSGYVSIGYKSANKGSGSMPHLIFDNVKITTMTSLDYKKEKIRILLDEAYSLMDNELSSYEGLMNELNDGIAENELDSYDTLTDEEEAESKYEIMSKLLSDVKQGLADAAAIEERLEYATNLYNTTAYPGSDALGEVIDDITDKMGENEGQSADYAEWLTTLNTAIDAYNYSQEATEENPANFTFLVKHPFFINDDAEPTKADDGTFVYPNVDKYTNGSKPEDANSEGWTTGTSGGDQRVNYVQQNTCWNAWRTSFDYVSINQELTNLPNGYYKVSADVITQAGCITDQHVFAKSSVGTSNSPVLSTEGWVSDSPYNGTWETLTTGTVVVNDGKLTIGCYGTGDTTSTPSQYGGSNTDYRRGWFCVTNFQLLYCGEISDEDYAALYKQRVAEFTALADTMHFAADKAAFESVIAANSSAITKVDIDSALSALTAAETVALASESKYAAVMAGTYAGLQDSISSGAYVDDVAKVAQKGVDLATAYITSSTATYTEADSITAILRGYRDTYLPVLKEASSLTPSDATAAEALKNTIASQLSKLENLSALPSTDELSQYAAELQNAINVVNTTEFIKSGATDYTSLIINPTIAYSDNKVAPNGWTASLTGSGNSLIVQTGQQWDGDTSTGYLDAWNGSAGKLLYTVFQTVSNLPNGIYRVKGMFRTTGTVGSEGYYLFASTDTASTDFVFRPIHVQSHNYTKYDGLEGASGDSIGYVSDTYGEIWEAAMDATDNGASVESGTVEAAIIETHGGIGYGWMYRDVEFEVTNHQITFGITTDSTFTAGYTDTEGKATVPFTGTWVSADNFTLTLVQNNDPNYNPASGVQSVAVEGATYSINDGVITTDGKIYTIGGVRVAAGQKLPAGVYIIKNGKSSSKVLVK